MYFNLTFIPLSYLLHFWVLEDKSLHPNIFLVKTFKICICFLIIHPCFLRIFNKPSSVVEASSLWIKKRIETTAVIQHEYNQTIPFIQSLFSHYFYNFVVVQNNKICRISFYFSLNKFVILLPKNQIHSKKTI